MKNRPDPAGVRIRRRGYPEDPIRLDGVEQIVRVGVLDSGVQVDAVRRRANELPMHMVGDVGVAIRIATLEEHVEAVRFGVIGDLRDIARDDLGESDGSLLN